MHSYHFCTLSHRIGQADVIHVNGCEVNWRLLSQNCELFWVWLYEDSSAQTRFHHHPVGLV